MASTRINFAESAAVSSKSRLTFERWDVRLRMDAVKRMGLSLSLSLPLRGIVIYDVGVVGRDTSYLPISTKFVTLRCRTDSSRIPVLSSQSRTIDATIIRRNKGIILFCRGDWTKWREKFCEFRFRGTKVLLGLKLASSSKIVPPLWDTMDGRA